MKSFHFLMFLLGICACLGEAQDAITEFPTCALECMSLYLPASPCSISDQNCMCANTELQDNVTKCVLATCSVKEGLTTQKVSAQTCGWPYHDKQPLLRAVILPFFIVSTLFFAARITARLRVFGGQFGPDDYMITAAWLFALGLTIVLLMLATSGGLGKDIWEVPFESPDDKVTYTLQLFTALEKLYIPAIWSTKIAILLLYLRVFPDERFRRRVKICIWIYFATAFCLFWACLFKCWPVSYSWTFWDGEHHGSCSSMNAQGWANAALNIVEDLIVLVLPWPTIRKLNLSREKKIGIVIMFGVGIFITIVSMIRLYTMKVFNFSKNPTRDFVNLSLWSAVEIYVSIICACLPGTRNFYNRVILGKILGKGRFASRWPLQHNYSPSPVSFTSAKFPVNTTVATQHVARTNSASSASSASDAGSYSRASNLEKGSLKEFVLVVDGPVPAPVSTRNAEHGRAAAVPVSELSDVDLAYHWNRSHPPTPMI